MRPDVALNTSRTIFGSDMRATARRVPTPVHLVQAAFDVAVPREVGDWLAAAIPNATLDVISASGHLPHMTAPAEVLAIVKRRLAGALS
jgi:sigma-B regulation protein RsbQ